MYKVFLSHNMSRDEMVIAWRLQTLAAASGLQVEVPTQEQRQRWPEVAKKIDAADCLIAFYTSKPTNSVLNEVEYARHKKKTVIVIAQPGLKWRPIQGIQVFFVDLRNPGLVAQQIAAFLEKEKVKKDAMTAILALAGTLLGLYLLEEASTK